MKKKGKQKRSFPERLNRFMLTTILGGIVVVLPITLFILLIRFIINFLRTVIQPIKEIIDMPEYLADWVVDLTALGIVLGAFFMIGLFVQTNFGKQFWNTMEAQLLGQLPFYTTLRDTVRQFFGNKDATPFSQVVSVDVFSNGTRMIGFISDELPDGRYTIFVPTGPNPTNGFIFCVEGRQLERLDVRTDEAMRVIVGVGTGASALFDASKAPQEDIPATKP